MFGILGDLEEDEHLLDSEEGDKHHADLAILDEEDMDEPPLDPDIGLASQDLVEDTDSGRLFRQDVGQIVVSSSHLGLDHPEKGIEGEEVLLSPPFAPCVVQRSWGGG